MRQTNLKTDLKNSEPFSRFNSSKSKTGDRQTDKQTGAYYIYRLAAAPRRPCPFGAPLHVGIWFAWRLRRIKWAPSGQAAHSALRAEIRAAAPHCSCPLRHLHLLHLKIWLTWRLRRTDCVLEGYAAQSALRVEIRAAVSHYLCLFGLLYLLKIFWHSCLVSTGPHQAAIFFQKI